MKRLKLLFPVLLAFITLSPANSQTISNDAVLANWNFTLKPGVLPERFEKFMIEEYTPAFEKNFTGVELIVVKGDRGVKKDGYCSLLIFKSIQERNLWWPQDGISSEKAKAATEAIKSLDDRLNQMITWESFTDWIVL